MSVATPHRPSLRRAAHLQGSIRVAVAASLALVAAGAAAAPPPLPSLDGVNPIGSGVIPNTGSNGGTGVVRTSGGSTGLPVTVAVDGTTANIQTAARRAVIDWQSFNIGEGYRVNFLLPDRASIAVNRVRGVGADFASRIDGDLWSNGNVWLLNPNGVFFGATARVDVAGLLATPAYLRKIDDLIGVDGTFSETSTIGFNMPGSSFPTPVTTPGPVSVAAGAEILVRGGPAMFIVGSGVQGRTLTVAGTVTARTSDLVRGVLAPPSVSGPNGDYGTLPTDSDPAEVTSSQVVYAATGDLSLAVIERAIDEPSPPNPLSSNDLDLFEFTVSRGFAGRQGEGDQMAPEAILIEHTAKTVAGQVVVKAAAEGSVLLRRNDPRTDLGTNLGCDPQLATCTINRNADHDTYLYDPQTGNHQFLCAAGPVTETCGTIDGRETENGFVYEAFLAVDTTRTPDYGCPASDPDCAPGVRIRSSIIALDPRDADRSYGFSMRRSLDIDSAPNEYQGGLVLTRDASGRPVDEMLFASARGTGVVIDPRDAQSRDFDFGTGGGIRPLALELLSAGDLGLRGRDICVTSDGSCFQEGVIHRSSDPYAAARVNLRLQAGIDKRPTVYAERLLRLEETFLAGAELALVSYQTSNPGGQQPLRQLVLRNGLIDPDAGSLNGGYSDDPVRIVVGTAADATNGFTLGSIFGGNGTDVDVDVRGMLTIIDTFRTGEGAPPPGNVSAGNISLKGRGISVGDLNLTGLVDDEGAHTLTLLSRATDPAMFSFGRISAYAPNSTVSITSAATLEFDPLDKLNTSALPDNLRLVSTGGKLCVGSTDADTCIVSDLDFAGFVDLQGQLGIETGAVKAGREVRLRAAAGSVVAGDVEGKVVDIQAGAKLEPPAGSDIWSDGEGSFTASVGDITALDGTVLVLGRDGVAAGDVSQARIDAPTPQVAEVELRSKSGSIVAGTVESLGADPAVGGRLKVETAQGALISLAAVTAGDVDVRAGAGRVRIGSEDDGFTPGAVTALSGRVSLEGRDGVEAGTLTATTQVNVSAGRGGVVVGDVSAGGTASAGDQCDGKAVCLGAGFDGTDGSGRTLTTGTVSASVGEVLMVGRDRVTTGGAVTAAAGRVEIRSASGTVDTTAGTVTAGSVSGAYDAVVGGQRLSLGDVIAQRDVDLTATAEGGVVTTGTLTARRALKVSSVADLGIEAAQIGGSPQSIRLTSSGGRVCLGTVSNGACTGQALTKDTDLTLQGKTGVGAGDLSVRSVLVDSVEGAASLGDVTATAGQAQLIARDGVTADDVRAATAVEISAAQGTVVLGDVTASDGRLLLHGRTGVQAGTLTQSRTGTPPNAPSIDLLSVAGAVTVGDITGTGLLYGRASGLMSAGTIGGVKDIDLRAGGTLTAGTIDADGFVQLQSVDGSLDLQGITAGAAKDAPDTDPCKGSAICLRAGEGATSGVQDIDTGALVAAAGDILVRGRSAVTVGGAEATAGAVVLRAFEGTLTAGAVTAGRFIDIESSSGSVTVGALTAGAVQSSAADDPCDGTSVCVQAGAATPGGTQSASVGAVTADAGDVLLAARNGLTLAGVAAVSGGITAKGGSGDVTATGSLTAGTGASTDADHDIVVEGAGLALQGVRASGDIALAATSATGALTTGVLDARRALVVESVAGFAIGAAKIGGTPESIDLSSSAGSICIGTTAGGVCTGEALIKDPTDIVLSARTGVTAGDIGAKSLQTTVSEGAAKLGDVTSAGVASVSARDGVAAGDVSAATSVSLVAAAGTVAVGDVTASDGTMLLQGRTGVTAGTLTQARTGSPLQVPDIDLIADGGSIAVGGVSGSGSLRGRALDDLSVGAVNGVDAVDLSAGKALSASGSITSRGFVELRSDAGNMTVQDVTAGAAKQGGSADPCAGKAICVRAGAGASTGAQNLSAGKLTASQGDLFVRGRSGVTAGDVRADRGVIDIGAAAGGVALGAVRGSGAVTVAARDALSAGAVVGATTDAGDVVMSSTDGALTVKSVTAGTATVLSSVDLRSKGDLGVTAGGATRGDIVASGGARLESGAALSVGDVTATQDVRVKAQDALSAGAVRSSGGTVKLESVAGAVTAASVTGRGAVDVLATSGRITVGSGSGSSFTGGAVNSSDAGVTLTARDGVATGALRATDATVTATGGDVAVGAVDARTLTVSAAAGQGGAGDVRLGGAVTLTPAVGTPAGATPALRVQAARDITVAGAVTSERNVAFVAGRNFANTAAIRVTAGTAADGTGAAGYGGIDIRAADVDIGAQLQARGAGVNLLATGVGGIALGDGLTAPSGAMRISDAEFQSIDAPTAALRSAVSSTAGRDIVVGDLSLDRARIGELLLATRQGGKVRVTGTVRGTGAPAMRIGETGMRPDTIEVSGALGTLAAPIGALQLRSAGNILFGPQAFIDAANAAQDILAFDVDAASQGATAGRLFLVSGATSFDTPGAILQQNTGPSPRDGDGLRIGAPAGSITATFATGTPPQRIELFGRVVDAQGNVTSAQQASLVAGLLPEGTASNAVWRLNTCVIGSGAGCAGGELLPPPSTLLQPPLPPPPPPAPGEGGGDGDPGTAGGGAGSGGGQGDGASDDDGDTDDTQPVPLLADAGPSAEEQRIRPLEVDPGSRDLLRPVDDGAPREPGVGSANEDLWPQGAPPR